MRFAGLCALLTACTPSAVDIGAERESLRRAADAYHAAAGAADADGVSGHYTSDGLIVPPNGDVISGMAGIREFSGAFTQMPGFGMTFGDMTVDVGAGGDMGYTLVDLVITVDGPDGEPVDDPVRDFHLWKKDGGEWKVAVDVWNTSLPLSGAAGPLEGAWIVTSWTDPDGNVNDEPQPAMYVFTPTHYAIMIARSAEQRSAYEGDEMTDAEKLAAYDTIVANAGRYEIDGDVLTTRAYVAKDPNYMGGWPDNEATYEFERDGETLTITSQGFDAGTIGTFRQVEGTPNPW